MHRDRESVSLKIAVTGWINDDIQLCAIEALLIATTHLLIEREAIEALALTAHPGRVVVL